MAISAQNLVIGYQTPLRAPISLQIGSGEAAAVVGPNGSGKTTFFHTLLGIIPGISGTYHLEPKIGVVFQDRALPLNVSTKRWITHIAKLWDVPINHELLNALNITLDNTPIRRLSGGQAQSVALYTAMAHKPQSLILDEPTNNLDAQTRTCLYDAIALLRQAGTSVLVSSHHAADISAIHAHVISFGDNYSNQPTALVTFSGTLRSIPTDITAEETATGVVITGSDQSSLLESAQRLARANNLQVVTFQVMS